MNMFAIERGVIVATVTETAEVITVFQKESAIGAVGPMAGQTIAVLDRRVDDRSFAKGFMTGGAQFLSLSDQRESFFSRCRMLRYILFVAGEAVAIPGGSMRSFYGEYRGMTGSRKTVVRGRGNRSGEKKSGEKRRKQVASCHVELS